MSMAPVRKSTLATLAVATLTFVAALLVWDTQREADVATRRLARTHTLLATALARDLAHRLGALDSQASSAGTERDRVLADLLAETTWLEESGQIVVLARIPPRAGYTLGRGGLVPSAALDGAFVRGDDDVVLTREQAAALGLGSRIAVAGLAKVELPQGPVVHLAVAGTARFERDAIRAARSRAVAAMVVAIVLVASFGGLVLVGQRREHDAATRLAAERRERERDDELARTDRLASLAALSLGIGHELSTPLGVILGRVEQLSAASDTKPRKKKALHAIETQVVRIQSVLRGFLSLARGDAPTMATTELSSVVRSALALVEHRFVGAKVTLVSELDDELEVACDPSLLGQVVINLLVNASSASPPNARVLVRAALHDGEARLEVIDEGEGISAESARRATEPFFTTRAHDGGSGLGLSIAREIVSHHGGTLVVRARDAADSRGTVAIVTLPLAKES